MNTEIADIIRNYNVRRTRVINDATNVMYINRAINHIYVINLETDIVRRNYITVLMKKYNINFEFITVSRLSAENYNTLKTHMPCSLGECGCYISHLFCLNDSIYNNYSKLIIFEDDIILHKKFHSLFEQIYSNITCDMLMLGANDFNFSKLNKTRICADKNIYLPDARSDHLYGTHAILYSQKGAMEVFNHRLQYPTFFDNNIIIFSKKLNNQLFVCFPNLAIPELSTTNLCNNFWITNKKKEDYYVIKCFDRKLNYDEYNLIYLKLLYGTKIDVNLSYKENMHHLILSYFDNNYLVNAIIQKRLVYNFFTTEELLYIQNLL